MKPLIKPILLLLTLNFMACANKEQTHVIASIPEASGIAYCKESNTLVVASDEGAFYELSTTGAILTEHKLGNYDLEGVVCEKEQFVFAIEGGSLLQVNRKTLQQKVLKVKGRGYKLTKKHGIEGMTKIGNRYYLAIQAKKQKKDANLLVVKIGVNYAKVTQVINHQILDSSGMAYHNKKLYILSDKKDRLYLYNLKTNRILQKIKLPKFAQEGIAFDEEGFVYFADDDGFVLKYREKAL